MAVVIYNRHLLKASLTSDTPDDFTVAAPCNARYSFLAMTQENTNRPYSSEENSQFREALERLLRERKWTQSQAAAEFGVTQQALSAFLKDKSGAGGKLVAGLCRVLGLTEREILDASPAPAATLGASPRPLQWATGTRVNSGPTLDSLPNWESLVAQAQAIGGPVEYAYEAVGRRPVAVLPRVTPEALHTLAWSWIRRQTEAELMAHETAYQRRQMARARAEADELYSEREKTGTHDAPPPDPRRGRPAHPPRSDS